MTAESDANSSNVIKIESINNNTSKIQIRCFTKVCFPKLNEIFVFLLILNFQYYTDQNFILNIFLDTFLEYS